MTKLITCIVFDEFACLDVVGPTEVFTVANQRAGEPLYELQVCTIGAQRTMRSESGLRLGVDHRIADVSCTHTLLISGGNGIRAALSQSRLLAEISRLASTAQRVVSICTGAFLLAETGLLDGHRATTHWAYADKMKSNYPKVTVVPDELFVRSGKFVTSAGIAAGIDLALALVEDDHGATLARQTSQRMVLYLKRSGGQSQFSERLLPPAIPNDKLDRLLSDLMTNPDGNCSNAALAERMALSERHFVRLFRARTGTTPARWIERLRVDAARELLEGSNESIEAVARRSGFASVDTFRQAFQRVLGMAPGEYRKYHG